MKDFRTFLALSVIFGLLLIAFILQDRMLPDARQFDDTPIPPTEGAAERLFPDLRVLDITAIQLLDPVSDNTFTIARSSITGQWTAVDREGTLDPDEATAMARAVIFIAYNNSFEIEEDTNLEQYGFRPEGEFYIQFTTIDGGQHVIAIGEPTFDSPTFYTLIDDRQIIYLVNRVAIDYLVQQFLNPPISEVP